MVWTPPPRRLVPPSDHNERGDPWNRLVHCRNKKVDMEYYLVPARKPPILCQGQRRTAIRRRQSEIRLHMQVSGSATYDPRQNQFQEFRHRKPTARDGTEQLRRVTACRCRSCRCNNNSMQIQCEERNRSGETISSTGTNTVKAGAALKLPNRKISKRFDNCRAKALRRRTIS